MSSINLGKVTMVNECIELNLDRVVANLAHMFDTLQS